MVVFIYGVTYLLWSMNEMENLCYRKILLFPRIHAENQCNVPHIQRKYVNAENGDLNMYVRIRVGHKIQPLHRDL
jgi:uncharacterized metal-binding protein